MIMGLCLSLITIGMLLCTMDMFIPIPLLYTFAMKMMGLGLGFIGIMILAGRNSQTGAGVWLDIPSNDNTICIHSGITGKRLDPNAKFFKTKNIGLGILKGKKKVFKDTGAGFRIAGHDVRRTHEKISADVPEWLGQYFYNIKQKYGVTNGEELKTLHDELKHIRSHSDLENIELLKPILKDDKKKMELYLMDMDDLRDMREFLFDGECVHMEDVENFIKLAKPNELDTWITQEINKNTLEKRNYRDPGTQIDWNKWLPALGMFMIIGILAAVILMSYLD